MRVFHERVTMSLGDRLTGNHSPGGPHLNFERGRTLQKPNGRESFRSSDNRHIFLPEER